MKENFPNLVKETDMPVQEAQSPKQDGCNEAHSKTHHKKKCKVERRRQNLKSSKRKAVSYLQGNSVILSADFSKETLQAGRDWQEIFKVMKSRDLQPRLLYSAKLSFRSKRK